MTTPLVNVNVNSEQFRINIANAYQGALASGDPNAPVYNMQTFGGNDFVQAQHVIPSAVAKNPVNTAFFDSLRINTIGAPGGAYVFKINDAQNGLFLPNSTPLNGTSPAVVGQQNGVFAAVHNGNAVEHGEYNTYVNKQVENIRTEYNNALLSASTPAARQQLALKAAAQLTDLQNTLVSGSFSSTASGVKYFLNNNDPILQARYATQGYGSMTNDQKRIFLQDNVYNQNINSNGDVLSRRMKDGSVQTIITNEQAVQSYLNNANGGDVNGLTHAQWVAQHNASVNQLKQQGLSDSNAQAQALTKTNDRIVATSDLRQAHNGLPGGEGVLLNTSGTPDGVARRKDALTFLADLQHNGTLKAGGKALLLLEIGIVATASGQAYAAGNTTQANQIIKDFGVGIAADAITDTTFTALATAAAAGVAGLAGVTLSLPALVVIGLVGGIAGSILFGDDVKDAINSMIGNDPDIGSGRSVQASEVLNRSRLALAEGSSPTTVTTPQNPNIFDLSADPVNLNPNPPTVGGTSGGQGLLGAGAGYQYTMSAKYLNEGGIANTAASNIAAAGTRPGDGSEGQTTSIMNALRIQAAAYRETTTAQMGGNLMTAVNLPSGTVKSVIQNDLVRSYADTDGMVYKSEKFSAEVYFDAQGTMIGLKPINNINVVIKNSAGSTIFTDTFIGGTRYVPDSTSGTSINNWSASGLKVDISNGIIRIIKVDYVDPVVLDSGNDGVVFSAVPVDFDLNDDGTAEGVSWTAPTDPLLVMDVNGDDRINNGTELVDLTDSGKPLNLFNLDITTQGGNNDKKLTAADTKFGQLKIWTDRNQDGYASLAELQTLSDLGIVSIDLDPAHILVQTVAGKPNIKGVTVTYANGTTRTLWDVPFIDINSIVNPVSTIAHSANVDKITNDGHSALKATSSLGVTLSLQGSGATQAIGSFGNDTINGTAGDDWLIGGAGADKFAAGDGSDLLIVDSEDKQSDIDAGAGIDTLLVADDRGTVLNLAKSKVEVVYGGYGDDVFFGGGADNYFIDGAAGDDLIIGGTADDVLSGADGADIIQGGKGDDLIRGGRDNDQLSGGDGNDVLDGGLGDDHIKGEAGNDVIAASGGTDFIDGGDGVDLIELQGNLEDYTFVQNPDGSWIITDKKNLDGSTVLTGKVSDRDGIQNFKNVERFSHISNDVRITLDINLNRPLPVKDTLVVNSSQTTYTISASSLLANDLDFQHLTSPQLSIYWVGDAIGGNVLLSNDKKSVIFTPLAGYSGPQEFSYRVQDELNNHAPTISVINNTSTSSEMTGRVLINNGTGPTDPNFINQWYLGAINANSAWSYGFTGKGVNVLVYETSGSFALDRQNANLNNPDLVSNKSNNYTSTSVYSKHATAVAGVIGAARNGIGGVGVAYDVTLNSIGRSPDGSGKWVNNLRQDLASIKSYDVVNNSWIYLDNWGVSSSGLDILEWKMQKEAIANASREGRNGLGTVMVYAAGNDREKNYDSGLSILTSNPYTINVGAINRVGDIGNGNGINKIFSERGANILVSAPGSNILTTGVQLTTADGTTIGSNAEIESGTSLAAPIVSGVVALMLEANSKLSYRDVQTILALTAKKSFGEGTQAETTWYSNHSRDWNGGGMHYSHDFGFGIVDAGAAVRMAESWVSELGHLKEVVGVQAGDVGALADLGRQIMTFTVTEQVSVEQAILHLKLDHSRWGDLVISLKSPNGTTSILLDRAGVKDGQVLLSNPINEITFNPDLMSTHFRGEDGVGTWTLTIDDVAAGGAGSGDITGSLQLIGVDNTDIKRYVFTDEYVGGATISPVIDKITELNASAVSDSVKLDISGLSSSLVRGKALSIATGIDRLLGGGGGDTLIGGNFNETILGGHGNDSITGGGGVDYLVGGEGNDRLDGGDGTDLLIAGSGSDTLIGGAGSDIFLVDVDLGGTTTVLDFNISPANGDTLRIRTTNGINFSDISQTLIPAMNGVSARLKVQIGTSTVILEGVTTLLTSNQLLSMGSSEDIPVVQGNYAYGSTVVVDAIGNLIYVPEFVTEVGWSSTLDGLAGMAADFMAITAGTIPSGYGSHFVTGVNLNEAFKKYTLTYVAPAHYELKNLHWREGGNGDDVLVEGSNPRPEGLLDYIWESALPGLGRPQFLANGGNDKVIGGSRDEYLSGGAGNDILTGGKGSDYLNGGIGADEFVFYKGDGKDFLIAQTNIENSKNSSSSYDDNEFALESSVARNTSAIELSDVLVFKDTNIGELQSNISFETNSKDSFIATTKLSYGVDDSITFSTIYTPNQLGAIGSDIFLYNARFADSNSISKVLDGKTITSGSDAIEQSKYGSKVINVLAGDDLVFALNNNLLNINGGDGNDTIYALEGGNSILGGNHNDRIEITSSTSTLKDTIYGGAGNDHISAGDHGALLYGDDTLSAITDGNDQLYGGLGNDTLNGGGGNDLLFGQMGADQINGDAGKDILYGGLHNDFLYGGVDDDVLSGEQGDDNLYGGDGNDNLSGGTENDILYGEVGRDVLIGGDGNDTLIGGAGDDVLNTGTGSDVIRLDMASGNDYVDSLTGVDIVEINGISDQSALGFQLLDNGARVKLTWGATNSLTLTQYSLSTLFKFTNGTTNSSSTLRQIFQSKGYYPDESFDFVGKYDTQLVGDQTKIGNLIGGENNDQLYGGPLTGSELENPSVNGIRYGGNDAAYWYVLGRDGQDSLAGGLSGAFLDGGTGDDTFRGTNGITIVRDTLHGGQDTLVMPEGITPESLSFYRIPNPMEAAFLQKNPYFNDYQAYVSASSSGAESQLNKELLPNLWQWNQTRYGEYAGELYWGSGMEGQQHFDTLRIQSADGKLVVDVVGYFDTGNQKNNISNIVFTTAFDAQGKSLSYSLDTLAGTNVKGGEYKANITGLGSANLLYVPERSESDYDNYHSDSFTNIYLAHYEDSFATNYAQFNLAGNQLATYNPRTDATVIVDGENGKRLQGNVKVVADFQIASNVDRLVKRIEDSGIVTSSEYARFQTSPSSTNKSGYVRAFNTFQKVPLSSNEYVRSIASTAVALPDVILGFGGNDTIVAGGAYVESFISNSESPSNQASLYFWDPVYGGFISSVWRYANWSPFGQVNNDIDRNYFSRGYDNRLFDQVNGGGGDDTYVYKKGDGTLAIIAIDERFAGAEGFDILDLTDSYRSDVTINLGRNDAGEYDGSLIIYVPATPQLKTNGSIDPMYAKIYPYNKIIVSAGLEGHLQVDQIKFKDNISVNVQDLINANLQTQWVAADGRTYYKTMLAKDASTTSQSDDFENIESGLSSSAVLKGSPVNDVMKVLNNGVTDGYEGGDHYLVDTTNTNFAVIKMDRGDEVYFHTAWGTKKLDTLWGEINLQSNGVVFAGSENSSLRYLGKTKSEWLALNILPVNANADYSNISMKVAETDSSMLDVHVELGKLKHLVDPSVGYSLADWHSPDDISDQITDALISWKTRKTDGSLVSHSTVLVGVVDSWGNVLAKGLPGLDSRYLTQGNDYISNFAYDLTASLGGVPDDSVIETFALGGNDTVAAYANDFFSEISAKYYGYKDILHGGSGNDLLDGGASNDTLNGGSGDDQLIGGFGNDQLNGGAGADTLIGGVGDDVYIIDASDVVVEQAGNFITTKMLWAEDTLAMQQFAPSQFNSLIGTYSLSEIETYQWYSELEGVSQYSWREYRYSDTKPNNLWESTSVGSNNWDPIQQTWRHFNYQTLFVHTANKTSQSLSFSHGVDEVRASFNIDLRDVKFANIENATLLGNTSNLELTGNAGNNRLQGNGYGSLLTGMAGDDIYVMTDESDRIIEGLNAGNDTIETTTNIWDLFDNVENLTSIGVGLSLYGNRLNNKIIGDAGNNILDGMGGNDTLEGGAGSDAYYIDTQADIINEQVASANDIDVAWVRRSYTLKDDGTNDIEEMRAFSGFDVQMTANSLNNLLIGAEGNDTLNGAQGHDSIFGGNGNDSLIGGAGNDYLNGGFGDDTLEGGAGNDTLEGGDGHDTYVFGIGYGFDVMNGLATNATQWNAETSQYESINSAKLIVKGEGSWYLERTLSEPIDIGTLTIRLKDDNGNTLDRLDFNNWWTPLSNDSNRSIYFEAYDITISMTELEGWLMPIDGTSGDDLIYGSSNSESIEGLAGNDKLYGNAGNDTLDGGIGDDTMVGGLGNDTYTIDANTDVITENLNEGTDLVNIAIATVNGSYTLAVNVENATLTNTVTYTVTGNELDNFLTGNVSANTLIGGDGNDTLNGAGGSDTMIGGYGNDTYFLDVATDVVTEQLGQGADTVNIAYDNTNTTTAVTLTLNTGNLANIENLTVTGTGLYNLTGSAEHNILTGNASANTLTGGDGSDTLNGMGGSDTMIGGYGNDTYFLDVTTDVITEQLGQGTDTVNIAYNNTNTTTAVTLTLNTGNLANIENLTITGTGLYNLTGSTDNNILTGNASANTLTGDDGNDTLRGLSGDDALNGGTGNDTLYGDDGNDILNAGVSGNDKLYGGNGNDQLTGNGNDILDGGAGNDQLTSSGGGDVLDGGEGADTMTGIGPSSYSYYVDNVGDVVIGTGIVYSRLANYSLQTNSTNLTRVAEGTIGNLRGNAYDNYLLGNDQSNLLQGLAGNDTLSIGGKEGSDILQGGAGDDALIINDNYGSVFSAIANRLWDGGDNNDTIMAGYYNYLGTGNDLLIGGKGSDILYASYYSPAGFDEDSNPVAEYYTSTGNDIVVFNKGDGNDRLFSADGSVTVSLGKLANYSELSLSKTNNDLVLKIAGGDSLTFADWYKSSQGYNLKTVQNMQVIADAMADFAIDGSNPVRNNTIETFNFTSLVAAFDAAKNTANVTNTTDWQLSDALMTAHIKAGSNTAAIGGDLAYQYGKNSNLIGMGLSNAQTILSSASFGQTAQTLHDSNFWQNDSVKLL